MDTVENVIKSYSSKAIRILRRVMVLRWSKLWSYVDELLSIQSWWFLNLMSNKALAAGLTQNSRTTFGLGCLNEEPDL